MHACIHTYIHLHACIHAYIHIEIKQLSFMTTVHLDLSKIIMFKFIPKWISFTVDTLNCSPHAQVITTCEDNTWITRLQGDFSHFAGNVENSVHVKYEKTCWLYTHTLVSRYLQPIMHNKLTHTICKVSIEHHNSFGSCWIFTSCESICGKSHFLGVGGLLHHKMGTYVPRRQKITSTNSTTCLKTGVINLQINQIWGQNFIHMDKI
jgi:hypothetical protein